MATRFGSYHDVEKRIQNAVIAHQQEPNVKLTVLARDFCVPYHRLRARVKGRNSKTTRPPTNLRLTEDSERALKLYIERCDSLGVPALLQSAVQYILDLADPTGVAPPIGPKLITRWLKRNPSYRRVEQKPQELTCRNIESYTVQFTALREVITKCGITPTDTYNTNPDREGPKTPTSTDQFKRDIRQLYKDILSGETVSPTRLRRQLGASVAIADAYALAKRDLADITAAANHEENHQV